MRRTARRRATRIHVNPRWSSVSDVGSAPLGRCERRSGNSLGEQADMRRRERGGNLRQGPDRLVVIVIACAQRRPRSPRSARACTAQRGARDDGNEAREASSVGEDEQPSGEEHRGAMPDRRTSRQRSRGARTVGTGRPHLLVFEAIAVGSDDEQAPARAGCGKPGTRSSNLSGGCSVTSPVGASIRTHLFPLRPSSEPDPRQDFGAGQTSQSAELPCVADQERLTTREALSALNVRRVDHPQLDRAEDASRRPRETGELRRAGASYQSWATRSARIACASARAPTARCDRRSQGTGAFWGWVR
jgi:hypothetical protein